MKSFKLIMIVFVVVLIGKTADSSTESDKVIGKVLSYGIYEITKIKSDVNAPNSVTGSISIIDKFVHIETTESIPLILGKNFGFKFHISNIPTDRISKFTLITTHPPIMNSRGEYQTKSTYILTGISPVSEIEDHFTYEFTTPNELVPGDWTLEIWRNGEKLVFKSFKVN